MAFGFMCSNTRKLAVFALFITFLSGVVCVSGSVTVGHSGSGADYICDGVDDEYEINQALATKDVVKLITDSTYNLGSNPILIPGNDIVYKLTANTPSNPPTIKAGYDNSRMIYAPNGAFDISYINFNGNGKSTHCIDFTSSLSGSSITHNNLYGFSTKGSGFMGCGIYGTNQNTINIGYNTIHDGYGVPIWVEGKTDPANRGAYANVYYNQILNNINYGITGAIQGEHMHIYNNNVVSYGFKSDTWAGGSGDGMTVSRSKVEYNVVRGCGGAGIKPTYYPMAAEGTTDNAQYYAAFANDAYNLVDHNIFEYNGGNGIDYWYSDGSIISNNRCNDNGQNDDAGSMDRSGIDVCDHSTNTLVNNNECTNRASTISDTVKGKGSNYIEVNNFNRWYDNRNGANVPFDGMYISVGGKTNRIDHIDMSTQRLYLYWPVDSSVQIGSQINGINKQLIGINVADNGQSLGGHTGSGNNVYGNLIVQIVPTINGRILPNTNISGGGSGPDYPAPDGSACTQDSQCVSGRCAENAFCCQANQCAWDMCVSVGSRRGNQWLDGICVNGYWQVVPGGYGNEDRWGCYNGASKISGLCKLPLGSACSTSYLCYMGTTSAGTCVECASGYCLSGACSSGTSTTSSTSTTRTTTTTVRTTTTTTSTTRTTTTTSTTTTRSTTSTTTTSSTTTTLIMQCSASPDSWLSAGVNTIVFQTPHNYASNMDCNSGTYTCPAGYAANIRVRYDVESWYDYFYVSDPVSGNSIPYSGNSSGYVWVGSDYNSVRFRFTSDGSINRWGVDVDLIGCYASLSTTTTTSSTMITSTTSTTVNATSTSTTTSTTQATTTTTMSAPCAMKGNEPPCAEISLSEVVDAINQWINGNLDLGQVIDLINSWADPGDYPPN